MLSVGQIKAARAFLGWSVAELSRNSGVGATTLRRYEMRGGIPNANLQTVQKIISTFESAGIEFTGDPLINPGVTLRLSDSAQPD